MNDMVLVADVALICALFHMKQKSTQVSFHVRETKSYRMRQEDKRKHGQLRYAEDSIPRGGSVETMDNLRGTEYMRAESRKPDRKPTLDDKAHGCLGGNAAKEE